MEFDVVDGLCCKCGGFRSSGKLTVTPVDGNEKYTYHMECSRCIEAAAEFDRDTAATKK